MLGRLVDGEEMEEEDDCGRMLKNDITLGCAELLLLLLLVL